MNPADPTQPRVIALDFGLTEEEVDAAFDRAWREEIKPGRKGGSINRFAFLAHHYAAEEGLKKRDRLDLFRKTQRLPDYRRAEDAVARGWERFMELKFGIKKEEASDKLRIRQFLVLHRLRGAACREERQRILRSSKIPCGMSATRGDDEFFRRLGHALKEPPREEDETYDFAEYLLSFWLTGFWWLMPLVAVAEDMARRQGDLRTVGRFNHRLKQYKSRTGKGGFFTAGWGGCFYSTDPPLIERIETHGTIVPAIHGRRWFRSTSS